MNLVEHILEEESEHVNSLNVQTLVAVVPSAGAVPGGVQQQHHQAHEAGAVPGRHLPRVQGGTYHQTAPGERSAARDGGLW